MKLFPVLVAALSISSATGSTSTLKAKIPEDAARASALRHVSGGTIKSTELEHEHGKLIYSFDVVRPNVEGVDEVHIDAMTGRFLGRKHESALQESVEQKGEAIEAKVKGHQ